MSFLLFNKVCLYNNETNETIVYGQYINKIKNIHIAGVEYKVVFCDNRPDFYIKIFGKLSFLSTILFYFECKKPETMHNITFVFPFENCDLKLNKETSAIISTICKDYSHRLEEWIEYNLSLGFSGIVIFNNDFNTRNDINECLENCIMGKSMTDIGKKYKGKVWIVDYPYSPLKNEYWNNIQRISLTIGVNAFQNKCRNIALIDADEFIYPYMNIESFLQDHNTTITMKSNILTNKNTDDILNNNILSLAKYVGEDKYTKTILQTDKIHYLEFINTPHNHPTQKILEKNEIMHYHCWMNNRYQYNDSMQKMDLFTSFCMFK